MDEGLGTSPQGMAWVVATTLPGVALAMAISALGLGFRGTG